MKRAIFCVVIAYFLGGCKQDTRYLNRLNDPELFHLTVKKLTDVIVYDVFSPPVASRVYAYSSIAAYEALAADPANEENKSFVGQLNGLNHIEKPSSPIIDYHLASLVAFLAIGKEFTFSVEMLEDYEEALIESLQANGLPSNVLADSREYGLMVARSIKDWASSDMYNETRSYPKYSIKDDDRYWKPTPPDYMAGIEPHWRSIRTMVLDSANQFTPIPPYEFSMDTESDFYKQLIEVYNTGINLDDERINIAKFWDCNPYITHHRGHTMFATKKITPGGHWVGITAITCRKNKSDFSKTVSSYAVVTISLFDAFISCWDEKWRSLLVRPETLINQYIDEEWKPLLQTPPFPEYTSGHSVISRAAAVTLTELYGKDFQFTDTTEVEYGLPSRDFESFIHASEEAAISRLYGGIHYMMAIENGVTQGNRIGKYVIENLTLQ